MNNGWIALWLGVFVSLMTLGSAGHAAGRWGPGPGGPGGGGNQPPTIAAQGFTVEENSVNATPVGSVVANDPDGDLLSYAITAGNLDGAFAIDAAAGALSVANSAALDFETTPTFTLTVQVTDTGGLSASAPVTVELIDLPEGDVVGELLPPPEGDAAFVSAHFSGSQNCGVCHNNLSDRTGSDVSIEQDWSASMMANASRDPFWRAKVASEIKRNPALKDVIDDKCSKCHAPMANVEAKQDGAPVEILGEGFLNPANPYHDPAVDGVSCTLCHQIDDDGKLGSLESFSGGYSIARLGEAGERWAFGQYLDPRVNPMLMNSGFRPLYAAHTASSELCATCHNLKTAFVDDLGEVVSTAETEFPEQMVFSEWENSVFGSGPTKTSCQSCHMPKTDGVKLSNRPRTLAPRDGFARHTLVGANTTMLDMLASNSAELGVSASGFDTAIARTRTLLNSAAAVEVLSSTRENGELVVRLKVSNRSGHKLPTSYPSRRAYIHFIVRDQTGNPVFESGKTNANGSIVGVDADDDLSRYDYEPHYQEITSPEQVQVYEPIMQDVNGAVTYTLLRAAGYRKDNRIPPAGFDKNAVGDDVRIAGEAMNDPDFNLGSDTITYRMPVGDGSLTVTAELRFQTLAYGYVKDLFHDQDDPEVARFKRLYDGAAIRSETLASVTTLVP